tara:strand:+ start:1328 stop:1630 length:303 start_codon:yes stop_codon:yes gene_type:complete
MFQTKNKTRSLRTVINSALASLSATGKGKVENVIEDVNVTRTPYSFKQIRKANKAAKKAAKRAKLTSSKNQHLEAKLKKIDKHHNTWEFLFNQIGLNYRP